MLSQQLGGPFVHASSKIWILSHWNYNNRKKTNVDWYNLILIMLTYFSSFSDPSKFLKCLCESLPHSSHKRTLQTSSSSLSSHLLTQQQQFRSWKKNILIMSMIRLLFPSYFLLVSIILSGFASSQTLPQEEGMYTYNYNHIGVMYMFESVSWSCDFCSGCFKGCSEGVEED